MRTLALLIPAILLVASCATRENTPDSLSPLRVSENGRYLETTEGDPFFWLGDTGWRLFERLSRKEAEKYLVHRSENGFTVIQCHLLPWDVHRTNVYGEYPFRDTNVRSPNEAYWQHVDYIIGKARELGLYMAVLPAWARAYTETRLGSPENKILSDDPGAAYDYGSFLGSRYREMDHMIWILGGDTWATRDSIYDNLARGITDAYASGDPDGVLISFHPKGGTYRPPATSSGEFYHEKEWLDFNMIQSGHRIGNRNFERIAEDYLRVPVKPTLESEPCYEHHPVRHDFTNGEFNAWHMRRRAYWSILAGGFGYTYGGNGIWQMAKEDDPGKESHFNYYWYQALDFEGGMQMKYVRALFESPPFITPERVPDQGILLTQPDTVDSHLQAARAKDSSYWMVYTTDGSEFRMKNDFAGKREYVGWWYNPRNGQCYSPDSVLTDRPFEPDPPTGMGYLADPPGEAGPGNDWILVLVEKGSGYKMPGAGN